MADVAYQSTWFYNGHVLTFKFTRLLFLSIMLFSYTLVFSALVATASASNVIDLTPDNFDSIIGKGKPALVEL